MDSKTFMDTLAGRLGTDKDTVSDLLYRLTEVVGDQLQQGDSISIPSFGQFEPRKRLERVAVHPSTGKKLLVPPKLTVSFRPSAILKQKVR